MRAGACLALLALVACGTQRVRPPAASVIAPEQIAIVRGIKRPLSGYYVTIQKVDAAAVDTPFLKTQAVELPPGEHLLEVSYVDGYEHSTENARLRLVAVAGRRYRVGARGIHEGFWSEMGKGMVGGKGRWTAWIEDEETHAVVAGRRASGVFGTTFEEPVGAPPPSPR